MKYIFIAATLLMFNPVAQAFDGHDKYENMSYEQLKEIDKKSLKGKDRAAYMKALKNAKKAYKGKHAKEMKGDKAHKKGHEGKMKAADHKKDAMDKKKKMKKMAKKKKDKSKKEKDDDDKEDDDGPDA